MKNFAQLVKQVGTSTKTNEKLEALVAYFGSATDADKVWTIAIFSGRRPRRFVNTRQLTEWCLQHQQLPPWLFEECYHTAGDLAETIALLVAPAAQMPAEENTHRIESLSQLIDAFIQLQKADDDTHRQFVQQHWQSMDFDECFVFNKLITGGFRIGVSQQMMVKALEKTTGIDAQVLAHRISGNWDPARISFEQLVLQQNDQQDASKPYPFYLAYQLADEVATLGSPAEWQAEWKWDGIRGQLIKRHDELFIWSRGEELMTDKFPEMLAWAAALPNGVVLDGEIVALQAGTTPTSGTALVQQLAPFAQLQTRITRKSVSKKQLAAAPVGFVAYDLLEWQGQDLRPTALQQRRTLLEQLLAAHPLPGLGLSPLLAFSHWPQLTERRSRSREHSSEGLMLKRQSSVYQTGRKVGDWWKWKIDPLTIDAVMIYAQKGHGRRSNLYTDYTFAVRHGDQLVSFAKAYSGLTDQEFAEVDAFVKRNSLEKFGPVRTVKPELVFEIAFEGIAASSRHKSGVALRFPRISRWRKDKKPDEINTLEDLKQLLRLFSKW